MIGIESILDWIKKRHRTYINIFEIEKLSYINTGIETMYGATPSLFIDVSLLEMNFVKNKNSNV